MTFVPASTAEPARTEFPLPTGVTAKEEFYTDVNNDGVEEQITITSIDSDDEYEFLTVLEVSGDPGTYTESIEGCEYISSYIIHVSSGKVCLLIKLADHITYCSEMYSFDGIRPVKQYDLGHITGVSGMNIKEEGPVDALGTWHYSRTYRLNDDLSLESGEYQIIMDDKEPLHTIRELPVELLTDGVYTKSHIDAGEDIIPVSTDSRSYLKFRFEDDSEGRILLSEPEDDSYYSEFYINGESEYEYFDNIDYTDMWY